MRTKKILIPLFRDEVAPRFDLAVEVLILVVSEDGAIEDQKTLVLPHASADELCDLILAQGVGVVICGGVEEEYYHYLRWKRVDVIDAVAGPAEAALNLFLAGRLRPGEIVFDRGAGRV